MKERVGRVKFKTETIPMCFVGLVFSALGITLLVMFINFFIKGTFFAGHLAILIFLVPSLVFGAIFLTMSAKNTIRFCIGKYVLANGEESVCLIENTKSIIINNRNRWYALTVSYYVDGNNKKFTTDYLFDSNELRYLKKKQQIKIYHKNNFVVIGEDFPPEIYTTATRHEIPVKYFSEKPFSTLIKLLTVFSVAGLLVVIAGIVISAVFKTPVLIYIGLGSIVVPNLIIGIIYAVHFFGKKK